VHVTRLLLRARSDERIVNDLRLKRERYRPILEESTKKRSKMKILEIDGA
jgi:hypothetical protein